MPVRFVSDSGAGVKSLDVLGAANVTFAMLLSFASRYYLTCPTNTHPGRRLRCEQAQRVAHSGAVV
jgi:hypothetical protein